MSLVKLLLCIIAFAGPVSGIALAYIAPEEIKPYRRYLMFFAAMMFGITALLPLIERGVTPYIVMPLFIGILWLSHRYALYLKYAFPLLGTVIVASGFFLPIAVLFVFASGLPLGSLDMERSIRNDRLAFDAKLIIRQLWPYSLIILVGISYLVFL